MKKIVVGFAAIAMAASMFAVDFAARTVMEGSIASGTVDLNGDDAKEGTFNFWNLSKKDQKDEDALVVRVNGDKAGAHFRFWYNYAGDDAAPKVRTTYLWFKPIDMLKITVGDVSVGTYKESMDWWKTPAGEAAAAHGRWTWSGFATVEGSGISAELTPIAGLWLNAGITAGAGNNFITGTFNGTKDETYAAWGAAAKYDLNGLLGLPLSTAISYRDAGKDGVKILAVGAEYGNRWGDGIYGFLNARFRFENWSHTALDLAPTIPQMYSWTAENALTAIALDNMVKFQAGAFQVMGRFPIVIRGLVKDATNADGLKASDWAMPEDPSYMSYEVKATYALGAISVYFDIENDTAVTFTKDAFAETFLDMFIQPGVTFNVGTASFDIGLQLDIPNKEKTNMPWSVPFNVAIAF